MSKIDEELMEFIENNPAEIATVGTDKSPHVAPKGSLLAVDEETIAYAEMYPKGQTAENIKENEKAAISVVNYPEQEAYLLKGNAKLVDEGEVYDKIVEAIENAPMDLPKPQYAGIIEIKEVINHTVGPNAGEKI